MREPINYHMINKGAFDCPYSEIRIRTFTKIYTYENFDPIKNTKENFSIVSGQNVIEISS